MTDKVVVENGREQSEEDPVENGPLTSDSHKILLKKLEAQNRLLEGDKRYHTRIMFRSGSIPSITDSVHSTDSSTSTTAVTTDSNTTALTTGSNTTTLTTDSSTTAVTTDSNTTALTTDSNSSTATLATDSNTAALTTDSSTAALTTPNEECESRQNQDSQSDQSEQEKLENQENPEKQELLVVISSRKRSRTEVDESKKQKDSLDQGRERSQSVREGSRDSSKSDLQEEERGGEGRGSGNESEKKTAEEDLWETWSVLMKSWEESSRRQQKLIKQLVRQGIPAHLRGMAWQLLTDSHDSALKELYPSLITEVSPFERQIQRDLARTFPEHSFFKERDGLGQESLLNVMKAYSVYDREVGYCQGSPFITGLLLMQMPEEDAFCVLVRVMKDYKLRGLFKPSMADLGLCFFQIEKLVEEMFPQLHVHFQALGFQTSMYASAWFLTMFASVLSLNVVFRIMDIFLFEGKEIIFRVGLALLEHSQTRLMQLDMEDMLKHLQREMKTIHEVDPNALIQKALKIKYNPKKMKKLEKEYLFRQEKKALENTELIRLQAENAELAQRLNALEKECASLADRLIQGQVSRAQEAEEMFILRKELAKMRRRVSEVEASQEREAESKLQNGREREGEGEGVGGGKEEEGETESNSSQTGSKDNGLEVSLDERKGQKKNVEHVCREEAQQVLRALGVGTPGTSPRISLQESPKLGTSPRISLQESPKLGTSPRISLLESPKPSPPTRHKEQHPGNTSPLPDAHQLARELAEAKLERAEASGQLDQKKMELKQALQREALVLRELQAAKQYVTALEQRLSEVQMEKLQCPHCSQRLGQKGEAYSGPADPSSSAVLFSHLRAMWNSQAATNGNPRNGRIDYGDNWT